MSAVVAVVAAPQAHLKGHLHAIDLIANNLALIGAMPIALMQPTVVLLGVLFCTTVAPVLVVVCATLGGLCSQYCALMPGH